MLVTTLALLLLASSALALHEQEYKDAFLGWTRKHHKLYASAEFNVRYTIFKKNLDYVNEWNAKNSSTILGMTAFADLTNDEYRQRMGTHIDGAPRLSEAGTSVPFAPRAPSDLPESVDWVAKGAVTNVKNQGNCGSCWSFSTTGSVEGAHFIATNNLVSLSEQNLIDCSSMYGTGGCNGGEMDDAFQYIIDNKGIDTEASYPYTMANETCEFKASNVGATISGFKDVTAGSEAQLQVAAAKQPVSVAIDASHKSFQLYVSGVYDEPLCSSSQLDHGVLVVGYGSDNGVPYWIVKNSWGTDWGQAGYIWMSRNKSNQCGIATTASFPVV